MELIRLSWRAMWERRGRTIGAIVGVAIAVLALLTTLSVSESFKIGAKEFLERGFRVDHMYVIAPLTDADVALLSTIQGVSRVIPVIYVEAEATIPGLPGPRYVRIYGVPSNSINDILPSGSMWGGEAELGGSLALVGFYVAFDPTTREQLLRIGDAFSVSTGSGSATLVVSGIFFSGFGIFNAFTTVFADPEVVRTLKGGDSDTYDFAILMIENPTAEEMSRIEQDVKHLLPNAQVWSPIVILRSYQQFFSGLQVFFGFVAAASALITAMWLYDSMTISVIQRTKEFGILRAIGFKRRQVVLYVFAEAIIVTVIGLAIGLALFAALRDVLPIILAGASQLLPSTGLVVSAKTIILSIIPVFLVNMLGALLPALRAGSINVVEALRYE